MVLADKRIPLASWREQLDNSQAMDLDRFVDHVHADHLPHAVLLDCTADEGVAQRYEDWLGRGIHVITPNKKAHSGSLEYYHRLKALTRTSGAQFLYETTVGAGLPVVHTLRDLVDTGDEIYTISGIFSGTRGLSVQRLRWQPALLQHRGRCSEQGLYGARPSG